VHGSDTVALGTTKENWSVKMSLQLSTKVLLTRRNLTSGVNDSGAHSCNLSHRVYHLGGDQPLNFFHALLSPKTIIYVYLDNREQVFKLNIGGFPNRCISQVYIVGYVLLIPS